MIQKVSVFVLRTRASREQLLVFDHPSAGVQVPAGTVEPEEEPPPDLHVSQQSWLSLVVRRLRELESRHGPS